MPIETLEIDVAGMNKSAIKLVENYSLFVRQAPKLLRDSMMLAYTTSVDDMLKAMDHNRIKNPVIQEIKPLITILDQNGNAT